MNINAKTILIFIGVAMLLYYLMRQDKPIMDQDEYDGPVGDDFSGLDEFMVDGGGPPDLGCIDGVITNKGWSCVSYDWSIFS